MIGYSKHERVVAGLMSGTSVDAIDVAITRIRQNGANIDVSVIAYGEFPWSYAERTEILKLSTTDVPAQLIAVVDRLIGDRFADALAFLVEPIGVTIDAIGFHGQTIAHVPVAPAGFAPSTLQLGNPHACAQRFQCPVIFDFRRSDMLSGGQGAPLVPAADSLMFHREMQCHPIAIQNIGGVGNVTYLAQNCAPIGFDTGPGNMVLDQVMAARTNCAFDGGGAVAAGGLVIPEMLMDLHNWHRPVPPPVSYGREHFGAHFTDRLLNEWGNEETADIMATVSEWTAMTISNAFQYLPDLPEHIFIAGGGAKNVDLIARLERLIGRKIRSLDHLGISSDAREAVAFAVLADARLRQVTFDLSRVTGSQVPQGLGAIALP